ncbi:transport and Golgi organization protein 1 homolog isoform X10 [Branchiostoma lanceolatum]|uniref:transport and Golgi organization protein 1 homolog isoform X10 n=1 Tax=Branchiostoma lanceolatum TaxID=7740 RepID=UPI003452EBFE
MAAASRLLAILAIVLSDFAFKSADSFIPQTQRCVDPSCREAISQGRARKAHRSPDPRLLSFNIHDVITVFSKEADKNGLWGGVVVGKEDKFGYFRKDALIELNIFHTSLPHIVPTKEQLQGDIQEKEDDTSHGHPLDPQDHPSPGSQGEDPRTMQGRGDPSVQRSQVPNAEEMVQYMGQEEEDRGAKPVRVQWEHMNYGDPSEQGRQNGAPPQEQQHGTPHHEEESRYEVPYHTEEGHPEQRTGGMQHDIHPSHQQDWPQETPPEAQHGTAHQEDPSPYGIHHQYEERDHGHPYYEHGENLNIHEESSLYASTEESGGIIEQSRSHRKKVKVKALDATEEDKDLSSMGVEDLNDYLESLYKDMGDEKQESQQQDAGTEEKDAEDGQKAKIEEEQMEDKERIQQEEKEEEQRGEVEKEQREKEEDEQMDEEEEEQREDKQGVQQENEDEVQGEDEEGERQQEDVEDVQQEDEEDLQLEEEEELQQEAGEDTQQDDREDTQQEDKEDTQQKDKEDTQQEDGEDTQQENREDAQQEDGEDKQLEDREDTQQEDREDTQQEDREDTQQEDREDAQQEDGDDTQQEDREDTQQKDREDTQQEDGEDAQQEDGEDTQQEDKKDTPQEDGEDTQQEDREDTQQEDKEDTKQEDREDTQQEDKEDTQQEDGEELEGADGGQQNNGANKEDLDRMDGGKQEGDVEEEDMGDDEEDDEGDEEEEEEEEGDNDEEEEEEDDDWEEEALDDRFSDVEGAEEDGKDRDVEKAEQDEEDDREKEVLQQGKDDTDTSETDTQKDVDDRDNVHEMENKEDDDSKDKDIEDTGENMEEDGKPDLDGKALDEDEEVIMTGEGTDKMIDDKTEESEEELMEDENAIAANQLRGDQEQDNSEAELKEEESQEDVVNQGDAPAEYFIGENLHENQASNTEEQSAQLDKQDQVPQEGENLSQDKALSSDEDEASEDEKNTEEEEQLEDENAAAAASELKDSNVEVESGFEENKEELGVEESHNDEEQGVDDSGTAHDQIEDETKESQDSSSVHIEQTFDGIVEDQDMVPGEGMESSDGLMKTDTEPSEFDEVGKTELDDETTDKHDLDMTLKDNAMKDEQEATDELFKDLIQKTQVGAGVDDLDGLTATKMDEPDVEKLLETPQLKEIRDKIMDMSESITEKTRERTETLLGQLGSKLSFATADATDVNSPDEMEENLLLDPDPKVKDEQGKEHLETEEKVNIEALFPFGSGENARQQLREQVEKLTKSDDAYQKQQERLRQEMLEWTAKMKEKREEARRAKENRGETVIDGTTIDWDEVLDDDVSMSTEDLPFDWDEVLDKEAFMSEYSQIMGHPYGEGIMPTSVQTSPDGMLSTPAVDMKTGETVSGDGMVTGDLDLDVAKPGMQQLLQGSEVSPSIGAADATTTQQTEPLQSARISETSKPSDQASTQMPQYVLPDEPARGYGWDGQSTEQTLNLYLEGAKPEQVIEKVGLDSEKLDALRAEEEKEEEVLPDQTDAASVLEAGGKEENISQTDTEDIYIELDFQFLELLGALVPPEWAEQLRGWGLEYTPSDLIFQGIPIPWLAVVTTLLVGIVTFCVFSYKCVNRCIHGKPVDPAVVKKQLEAEIDKAAKEKEDLRKGAEAAEDRIRELEETLDVEKFSAQALSKKNSELEEKLSSNDQLEVTLRQEIQRLMDQVSDAREQLESATSEYAKQQEIEAEYKKNLKKERKEKEKLQGRLTEIESKTKHLDSEIVNIKEHRDLLEESKHQLEEEIQGRQEQIMAEYIPVERFTELKESIEMIKQENDQLKENVQYKENEIEALQVLRDCLMQIKALESEDAAAIEEDTDDASTAKDEKIQQMLDVARINSTLKLVESERDYLRSRLEEADGSRKEYEDKTDRLQMQVDNLAEAKKRADKQYYEAQVRLNTLQDYFKEKEVELQRKLGKEEMIRQDVSGKVQDTQEKYKLAREQVELYQNQKDDLLKEMQESERSFRNQIASIEKKAHESWMAARTSEREAQDSKREAASLRQKLLEVENALAKEKDKYLMQSPPLIKPTPINGPPPFPPRFSPPLLPPGAPRHGPPFGRSPPPGRNGDFDGPPSPPPEMAFRGPPPPMGPPPLGPPPFRGPPDDFPDRDFDRRRPSSERDFPPDRDFDRRPPSEPFGHPDRDFGPDRDYGPGPHRGPPMDFPPPRGGLPPMTPPGMRRGSAPLPPMARGPPSSGRMSGPRELRGPPRRPDEESGSQDSRSTGPPSPPPMGIPRTSSPLDSPQHYMGPPPPGGPPPQHFSPHGPPPLRRSPNPPPMGRRPPPSDDDRRDRSQQQSSRLPT